MSSRRPLATGGLGALALVAALLFAWPAVGGLQESPYVDCSFSPADGVLRVHIRDEEGLVRRRDNRIRVLAPTGAERPAYQATDCGGVPTVHNTDLIRIRIDSVGSTTGRLSLGGGPFAPGRTPESGVPEIEVLVFARERDQELVIEGTRRDDRFRAGRLDGAAWANLNPGAEGASPDADLRLPSRGATAGFGTRRGDDIVVANGGPEFDGPLGGRRIGISLGRGADHYRGGRVATALFTGRGADSVVTGRQTDIVFNQRGDDSIRTRGDRDGVFSGRGNDRVWTGRGDDLVYAKDGRRDRVRCGPGSDRAGLDAFDRARSCERDLS